MRTTGSFLVLVGLGAYYFATQVFPSSTPGYASGTYGLMAIGAVAILAASIVVHELGHLVVGRLEGMQTGRITLWGFGGLAHFDSGPPRPRAQILVALAGPAATLGCAYVLYWLSQSSAISAKTQAVLSLCAGLEFFAVVLNLLPIYPLDGGSAVHGVLWAITGEYYRPLRLLSQLGRVIAWVLISVGIVTVLYGGERLTHSGPIDVAVGSHHWSITGTGSGAGHLLQSGFTVSGPGGTWSLQAIWLVFLGIGLLNTAAGPKPSPGIVTRGTGGSVTGALRRAQRGMRTATASAIPTPRGTSGPTSPVVPLRAVRPRRTTALGTPPTGTPPAALVRRADPSPTAAPSLPSAAGPIGPQWPAHRSGWTVCIGREMTRADAEVSAERARRRGVVAGVLDSDDFDSLAHGQWVVYVGHYESKDLAARAARKAGRKFPGATPILVGAVKH